MRKLITHPAIFKWMVSALFGTALGVSLGLWFPKQTLGQSLVAGIAFITIVLAGTISSERALKYLQPRLQGYTSAFRVIAIGAYLLLGFWLTFNIPLPYPPPDFNVLLPALAVKVSARLSSGLVIGGGLLWSSVWAAEKLTLPAKANWLAFLKRHLSTKITKEHEEKPFVNLRVLRGYFHSNAGERQSIEISFPAAFLYALPMALIWGVYLLAFYPGMMSVDSMNQWGQVLTGVYNDHHPAFHTFLIWLVTRISLTPATVAMAQIIALALVAGGWLAFLAQIRLPRWLIGLTAAVFALSPVNGTMVNTLWKDIPYSTAVLGLTLILVKVVYSRGEWMAARYARIILGITLALVLLLRHDGAPVAIGTLGVLFILYPTRWSPWLTSALVCALLYLGVRGPIYQWVGVQRSTELAESSLSLWSMAAFARPGSPTAQVIASLNPAASAWSCTVWQRLDPTWRQTDLDLSPSFPQLITNVIQRVPAVFLYYLRCERSMEWVVWDPYGEVRNTSHVQVLVDPNPFGLRHDSQIPLLRDWIASWVMTTARDPNLNWFIWRPAFFLYFHLMVMGVLVLRHRDFHFLVPSIPILIQSVTFSLILAAPNFRYHYAVYLVSLISFPLLFSTDPARLLHEDKV